MLEQPTDGILDSLLVRKKKKLFFFQPDNFFFLAAILLTPFPLFFMGESVSFHLHDTFLLISNEHFIYCLAIFFLLIWIIYKLTNRLLFTRYLTWLHLICTLVVLFAIMDRIKWFVRTTSQSPKDYIFRSVLNNQFKELKLSVAYSIVFITGQLAYLVNLLAGVLQRVLKSKKSHHLR